MRAFLTYYSCDLLLYLIYVHILQYVVDIHKRMNENTIKYKRNLIVSMVTCLSQLVWLCYGCSLSYLITV